MAAEVHVLFPYSDPTGTSRHASQSDVLQDITARQKTKQKPRFKVGDVPHGIPGKHRRHGPPADPNDWPGWYRTQSFRVWIKTARGLKLIFGPEYTSYRNVLGRCRAGRNQLDPAFATFRDFLAHALPSIGRRPTSLHTLDRSNNADPMYGPGLVRWADKMEQAVNRRSTKRIRSPDGKGTTTIRAAANSKGILADTVRKRIRRGWTHEEALAGRRIGTRGCPTAAPDVWPLDLDPSIHARAYFIFLETLPPDWRPGANRLSFLWCLYVPTLRSARQSKAPLAADWLARNEATAERVIALLAPASMQRHRVDGEAWMRGGGGGSFQYQRGCLLTQYGIKRARFELGWIGKEPVPPKMPEPPPRPFYPGQYRIDSADVDPADVDPGDLDPGDLDPGDIDPKDYDHGDLGNGHDETGRPEVSQHVIRRATVESLTSESFSPFGQLPPDETTRSIPIKSV